MDAVKAGAQILLPPHADALEELLIMAQTRQFFLSTILEDLRKQHEGGRPSTAANELSQGGQEIRI